MVDGDWSSVIFSDRRDAGRQLAERLAAQELVDPVVLALPRGGVPVAYEVARRLRAPLDVIVARKIGAPWRPELGVGAIAEGGEPVFDPAMLAAVGLRAVRQHDPRRLLLAVPVCASQTVELLRDEADDAVCLHAPADFMGVGQWYRDFAQTSDETVIELLARAAAQPSE